MNRNLKFQLTAAATLALLTSSGAASAQAAYLTAFDGSPGPTMSMPLAREAQGEPAAAADEGLINDLKAFLLTQNVVVFEDADGRQLGQLNADGRAYLTRGGPATKVAIRAANGVMHIFNLSTAKVLAGEVTADACMVLVDRGGVMQEVSLFAVLAQLGWIDAPESTVAPLT